MEREPQMTPEDMMIQESSSVPVENLVPGEKQELKSYPTRKAEGVFDVAENFGRTWRKALWTAWNPESVNGTVNIPGYGMTEEEALDDLRAKLAKIEAESNL